MATKEKHRKKSNGWAAASKTQFKKGLNGLKKAEIVSQEIDLSKRKVAKEGYAVKEELLPDWMKGDESKIFTKESMAKTAGLAKEKAFQPVFPEPMSTHRGEGEEGKKKAGYDTELFAAQDYLVKLDRCRQFRFTDIQDISIDYLALGTMLGYLGLERFLGVEYVEHLASRMPKDMPPEERLSKARKKFVVNMIKNRKIVTDAVFKAAIRLTKEEYKNVTEKGIRYSLEESDFNKVFRNNIQAFERGFDYLFGLTPADLKLFVRFLTDDPEMDLMTHARLSHMGNAMGYGNEMEAFLERAASRKPVYRQLLERPDNRIRRVYEFVVPVMYGALPNAPLSPKDKDPLVESFLTILKLPGKLERWKFIKKHGMRDIFDKAEGEEATKDIYMVFTPEGRYHEEEARLYFSDKFGQKNISKLKFKTGVN